MLGMGRDCCEDFAAPVAGATVEHPPVCVAPPRAIQSRGTTIGCGAQSRRTRESSNVANIKSQKKRILTNEKSRVRNKSVRSAVKTTIRRFHEAVAAGEAEKARELAREAGRQLDKAASKGVLHRNNAANRKSAIDTAAARLG
jgi:small subunit ribosomal protein S20